MVLTTHSRVPAESGPPRMTAASRDTSQSRLVGQAREAFRAHRYCGRTDQTHDNQAHRRIDPHGIRRPTETADQGVNPLLRKVEYTSALLHEDLASVQQPESTPRREWVITVHALEDGDRVDP